MSIYSFHLVKLSWTALLKLKFCGQLKNVQGLQFYEQLHVMKLGVSIYSPQRFKFLERAFFAQWENKEDLERFLEHHPTGKLFNKGWHMPMRFMRQWGTLKGLNIGDEPLEIEPNNTPVVAITIARMRPLQIPRFIRWGKPVEQLVRDHQGALLSGAAMHLPTTIATYSIWKSQQEMNDMTHGHSKMERPKRHIDAMKERDRKDFHFEFTTLRFLPLTEFNITSLSNSQKNIPHDLGR